MPLTESITIDTRMKKTIKFFIAMSIIGLSSCNSNQTQTPNNILQQDSTKILDTTSQTTGKVNEEIKYETYCNQRFGFCIDYPNEILFPQGESGNGDGQIFKSRDAENILWAYRDFRDNIDPEIQYTIETAYNEDSRGNNPDKPKRVITYKKLGNNFFVVSGYDDDKIFYQKSIMRDGQLVTCLIEYKESDKNIYNKISDRIFKSFK